MRKEQRTKSKELRAKRKVQSARNELLQVAHRFALTPLPFALVLLCILCGETFAQNQPKQPPPPEKRIQYKIDLSLDFENRKYSGSERVRWVNRGERSTGTLIFHLYSNARIQGYTAPAKPDEPRLEIVEVKHADSDTPVQFN